MQKAGEQVDKVVRERAGVMNTVRNVRLRTVITRVAAQRVFMPVWMVKYVYLAIQYAILFSIDLLKIYGAIICCSSKRTKRGTLWGPAVQRGQGGLAFSNGIGSHCGHLRQGQITNTNWKLTNYLNWKLECIY